MSLPSRQPRPWHVFGIPVYIHTSWYVVAALMTWSLATGYFPPRYPGLHPLMSWMLGATAAALLFVCVLLHELGHALTARRYGIPVLGMTLFIFGGVAHIGRDPSRPLVELLVALAGPLVSGVLAALCVGVLIATPAPNGWGAGRAVLVYLSTVNIGIIVFNLLPGFPLDGGRVLRALLWMLTGNLRRATKIASLLGIALGFGLILVGALGVVRQRMWSGGLWWILLGGYLQSAAAATYRRAAAP